MGKKKGLAAIFSKPSKPAGGSPPWPWPSCATNPQTASFRRNDDRPRATARQSGPGPNKAAAPGDDMYRTVNSVYFDPTAAADSFSIIDEEEDELGDALESYSAATASEEWSSEAVIRRLGRGACTDRLFFDPPPVSNSTLSASREPPDSDEEPSPLVERSVAVALDSDDPHADFRASMEEMVAAHGLRDWAALQDMLLCYLRINAKRNHALILGAFVDLLVLVLQRRRSHGNHHRHYYNSDRGDEQQWLEHQQHRWRRRHLQQYGSDHRGGGAGALRRK